MSEISTEQAASPTIDPSKVMIDPDALMRIKSMELRVRVMMEGFWRGLHRSPYHGFSTEFTEYRPYTPGDDPRQLDWRLYARSDRYYIKKYEDETNLRCHLLVDQSKSMGYGSLSYTKAQYAGTLAATLAYFLHTQGDAIGLITFDDKVSQYMPPRNRSGHLRRLMLALETKPAGSATELKAPLEQVAQKVTKRGLVVLISDLLAPIETLEESLGYLRACGHEVVLFNILDPSELHFDFETPAMFWDLESEREMYIDPSAVKKQYLSKINEHLASAKSTCRNLGIDYHSLTTDRPFGLALLDFLNDRMRHGKQIRRRGPRSVRTST